jgi:hypothetical protein
MKRVLVVMIASVALGSCGADRGSSEQLEAELNCAQGFSVVQCCKHMFPPGKARGQCVAEAARGRGVCAHPGGGGFGGGGTGGGGGGVSGSGGGGVSGNGGGGVSGNGAGGGGAGVGGLGGSAGGGMDASGDTAPDAGTDTGPTDADDVASDANPPPDNHCPTLTISKSPENVPVGGTLTVTATIFEVDLSDTPIATWEQHWSAQLPAAPFSFAPAPFSNPVPIRGATLTATVTCLDSTYGSLVGLSVRDNPSPLGCGVSIYTSVCAPWCGDGRVTAPEECDPPDGTTCDTQCRRINGFCGDGVVEAGETCEAPTAFCSNCQLTTCGGCFYAVGGGAGVCAGLSPEDTISCNRLVSCTSPGLTSCAFQTGPNVAPGILGCYCSDATCTAPSSCGTWFEALAHSNDPAEVIRQINDPTTAVGRVAGVMLRFGTSSCGRSCSGL